MDSKYNYHKQKNLIKNKKERNLNFSSKKEENSQRMPKWMKVDLPSSENYQEIKKELRKNELWTVCEEAKCPNISECWASKTATIMILGGTCTRACKFCHVNTGNPKQLIDYNEIENASKMVNIMNLNYIVITSVDRDDLDDFGSSHFSNVIKRIKNDHPKTYIEVLIPDFNAKEEHMHTLAKSNPFVIAQNIETVKKLTHMVRDRRAGYEKTLDCLHFYKKNYPNISTKTSLMLGFGEKDEEILETIRDLRKIDVDIITFGQYLRPTKQHLPVKKYYSPKEFEHYKNIAYTEGFKFVASGPLVRSSYKASDYLNFLRSEGNDV